MSLTQYALGVGAAFAVVTAGFGAIGLHASESPAQRQQQEQVQQLDANQKKVHAQLNDAGTALQDADNLDRLSPVEPRDVDPKLKWRFLP